MLNIFSVFKSIQGESTNAGLPCVFIRLAGCPLRCSYCDTVEARKSKGRPMEISQIVNEVEALSCGLVEVTGGEPLVQPEVPFLLTRLCNAGHEVMLETSGAFSIANVDPRVRVIMDIKCPDSGMSEKMYADNFHHLIPGKHEVKFVVSSRRDFDWAVQLVEQIKLDNGIERLVSPVEERVSFAELAQWVLLSPVRFRLQLQLHKLIWAGEGEER